MDTNKNNETKVFSPEQRPTASRRDHVGASLKALDSQGALSA